jgi:tRNA-splicing ligase RtcB (3'-phosphate/5'-hydroxy nucleic acid ligase)
MNFSQGGFPMQVQKKGTNRYILPARGDMKADALFFLQEQHLEGAQADDSIRQLAQAATLPGTVAAMGMPDIHWGFGLPIGGVLLGDVQEGVISAGAVGMDINCGVRILATDLSQGDVSREDLKDLITKNRRLDPHGNWQKEHAQRSGTVKPYPGPGGGRRCCCEKGFGCP